jgi:anaerobic magnesium-protoporphyrin IX monomethyl ester cyclase
MNRRVLFISPTIANRPWIPAAMPILAGIAMRRKWKMRYFDTAAYAKASDSVEDKEKTGCFVPRPGELKTEMKLFGDIAKDLQAIIDEFQPTVIAITAMTCCYEFLMSWWRQIDTGDALVAIGGFHAIVADVSVAAAMQFDIICQGQGEEVFDELLFRAENSMVPDDIDGTCWYDRKNRIYCMNPPRKLIPDYLLWDCPRDYSMFDESYFRFPFDGRMVNMVQIEAGRGCPYSCSYCGNDTLKRHYRGRGQYVCTRPMDSTFSTAHQLLKERNIDVFSFTDECFLARPKKWLQQFCARWKAEVGKAFLLQTRAETVTAETLDMLSESGAPFVQIGMGVESGSKRVLKEVCNRTSDPDEIIRAYDLMRTYPKIRTNAYFMIGLPTEMREEIWQTIQLCKRIDSKVNSVAIYQPFPGQALREKCLALGYITGNEPMESFTGGSVLKQPQISQKEVYGLWRTFMLYAKLGTHWYAEIERCEKDCDDSEKDLFDGLVKLRWEMENATKV